MHKLLILGAGILQIPVIKKAKELGIYTLVADGDPHAAGLTLADCSVVANITDKEVMLEIARSENIDGVIHPCSEVAMESMGYINQELHLHGINVATVRRATNKALMRQAFAAYGAPSPQSYCTETWDNAWRIFKTFSVDGILKPSRNSGSRGITKVTKKTTQEEFANAYSRAYQQSRDNSVLIEEFIDGPEFSIEGLVCNNRIHILTITDKLTTGAPHFVELGHSQPSLFSSADQNIIHQAVVSGIRALGLDNCAVHAEVKLSQGRAYIMEIGARLGGDFITTDLVPLSTGIDMVAASIHIALGISPDLTPKHAQQGSCIRYIVPDSGVLIRVNGLSETYPDWVEQCVFYRCVGDFMPEVSSSLDRSGHIIVTGSTAQEAISRAEQLLESFDFVTK
mgnify:FL=1